MTERGSQPRGLRVESDGPITVVTLSRPEVLNAIDAELLGELDARLEEIEKGGRTRVVILVGEGDKAFSAGGDIARMAAMSAEEGLAYRIRAHRLLEAMERSPIIFIAAINGYALGGGFELALACDLRLAARTARLGLPELTVGLIPAWGGMQRLSRLVGTGVAKDLVLTGRRLTAEEALERGIVSRVAEPDALMEECRRLARHIAELSPIATRQAKKSITVGREMTLTDALAYDVESAYVNFASADRVEGLRAFLEKRKPSFRGR